MAVERWVSAVEAATSKAVAVAATVVVMVAAKEVGQWDSGSGDARGSGSNGDNGGGGGGGGGAVVVMQSGGSSGGSRACCNRGSGDSGCGGLKAGAPDTDAVTANAVEAPTAEVAVEVVAAAAMWRKLLQQTRRWERMLRERKLRWL